MNQVARQPHKPHDEGFARPPHLDPSSAQRGFTLVELLVVIAIIAILASLLLPVLSQGKARAQNIVCINNLKELEYSSHLYTVDFHDYLVPNQVGGFIQISSTNGPSNVTNVFSWCPGIAPQDATPDNVKIGLLYQYNQQPNIYRCPTDNSTVNGFPNLLRLRSYCMSIGVGCTNIGRSYLKYTALTDLSPSQCFALLDTQEQDIWDGTFGIFSLDSYFSNFWLDLPADRHSIGANLSFLDGHVDHWTWRARKVFRGPFPAYSADDLDDLHRLQACARLGLD
ncbi:MAG TPA: type II secretion system protein [Verrucomicrobiae bacterium]|jgi:prepilin-type N-terminal cleavage/methylation domain-containing protein/prepilin-type processing-associated H-X9-DG protein|nr:type II secretion system protein [Verrucomicrobiae bacterium]